MTTKKPVKFRPHKSLLAESMAEVVEVNDRADLVRHLAIDLREWGYDLNDDDVRITPYTVFDDRIGWDTYIVTIRNKKCGSSWYFGEDVGPDYFGAIGYTNQLI